MKRILVALIIYKNSYLISKIPGGTSHGQWGFPSTPAAAETTDFKAIQNTVKDKPGIDIFPYRIIKTLLYNSPDEPVELVLIRCSITDVSKRFLSPDVPSQYQWVDLPFAAHIYFSHCDKKIVRHLAGGLLLVPPGHIRRPSSKPKKKLLSKTAGSRKRGFALMDPEKRRMIAGLGGTAAHASGAAHKWSSEEARQAGLIGRRTPHTYNRAIDMSDTSLRSQMIRYLRDFLNKYPGHAISFAAAGKELGAHPANISARFIIS